ncbi:hypothetical protein OROGR_013008 [Orobanche gracilis]
MSSTGPLGADTNGDMGIELEQSSSSRRGQGEEKRILILAFNSESVDLDRLEDGAERNCFGRNGFIYIVGGVTPPIVQSPEFDFQRLQCQSPISNRTFYFGGSSIDLSDEAAVWCPAPVFIANQSATSNYVSFLGKIYSFGSQRLEPKVLDPATVGHSEPIYPLPVPEHLVGCSVSIPVLPDPSKNRILVRLHGGLLSSPSYMLSLLLLILMVLGHGNVSSLISQFGRTLPRLLMVSYTFTAINSHLFFVLFI